MNQITKHTKSANINFEATKFVEVCYSIGDDLCVSCVCQIFLKELETQLFQSEHKIDFCLT